ncbi:ribonuclease H-like domain-containing protein [Tanacetum coccineum]
MTGNLDYLSDFKNFDGGYVTFGGGAKGGKSTIKGTLKTERHYRRKFSVARTPQQNGVAERRNRTLIEAARTMLADSKLPTTFGPEAVLILLAMGTNSNDFVSIEESIGAGHSSKETGSSQDYILIPLWKDG